MALIRNANPGNTSGSYERLFDNAALGELASKIQSAVISSGSELEAMIANLVPNISDLDKFLEQDIMRDGVLLARKRQIKQSQTLDLSGSEPDFIVFKRRDGVQSCHIVELKDGHVFDTKKASAEHQAMHRFIERNARHIQYQFQAHFCAFNQNNRHAIWDGFKRRVAFEEVMTGREFCDLVEINYDDIVKQRRMDGADNVEFFIEELLRIECIKRKMLRHLRDDQNHN